MLTNKHLEDFKYVLESLIDEVAEAQAALNRNEVTLRPGVLAELLATVDYASFTISGIMYSAEIDLTGEYTDVEDD
jgi:hypothetical protein